MSEETIIKKVKEMQFLNELQTQIIDTSKTCVVLDFKNIITDEESIIIDKVTMSFFIEAYIKASKVDNDINALRKKLMQ
ncbi:hypothetical protein N5U00_07975 [Aliarcobacter butzleri]|uniref:hypothetical protein n=1 Tax=Aliarcobacter butzleri TaxID=28197 RepID=UPI000657CADB|nr:hypothetical protein [Aliarcobacter butzleri]KLE04224.1 hypothetical protein AF78_09050 [Aliarcobacter butzleri L353]MCT7575264.1 hypothetical protein [Aliarcobacter butzleri]